MKKLFILLFSGFVVLAFVEGASALMLYSADFENMTAGNVVETGLGGDRPSRVNFGGPVVDNSGFAGMSQALKFNVTGDLFPAYDQIQWTLNSNLDSYYLSFDFATENFVVNESDVWFTLFLDARTVTNTYLWQNGSMSGMGNPNLVSNAFTDGEINKFEMFVDMSDRSFETVLNDMVVMAGFLNDNDDVMSIRMNFGSFVSALPDDNANFYLDNVYIGDMEPSAPVPEPATMILLGSGIICFIRIKRKKS